MMYKATPKIENVLTQLFTTELFMWTTVSHQLLFCRGRSQPRQNDAKNDAKKRKEKQRAYQAAKFGQCDDGMM
jgi:hypothetical protein